MWYKEGGYRLVLFMTVTQDSELRYQMQKDINNKNIKIKVVGKSPLKLVK